MSAPLIDWDSPEWGARATCVHESSTGSQLDAEVSS